MPEPVLSRVAEARTFLGKVWKLAAPYWWAEGTARDRDRLGSASRMAGALDRARAAG